MGVKDPLRHDRLRLLAAKRTLIMGILNVTPDSFSDGGLYFRRDAAVARADAMIAEGADLVDVGGESTRPGSQPISAEEQARRVIPVVEAIRLAHPDVLISVDARLSAVAGPALAAGADVVNDVSALRDDPEMVDLVRESRASVVLMHMRGRPDSMQSGHGPFYQDVVEEVASFLSERADWCLVRGVMQEQIIVDPGIGFGKRLEHNVQLLRGLRRLTALGHPVLLGASRKSFMGELLGIADAADRLVPSIVCAVHAASLGARILRVHDVAETRQALEVAQALADPN